MLPQNSPRRVGIDVTVPRPLRLSALATVALCVFASQAQAQGHPGVRAGVSVEPDQFYFGVHVETSPLVDQLRFRPNLEVGLGDEETLVALNVEFAYRIPLQRSPWSMYVGGGPAINIRNFHAGGRHRSGDTQAGGGFNILVGVAHQRGLFTELKVGALDSPDLKFGVGFTF